MNIYVFIYLPVEPVTVEINKCCYVISFFSYLRVGIFWGQCIESSVADPVQYFRIRILLRYVFDVKQNKYFFYGFFLPNLNTLWHLKSKIKKLFGRNCILDNFIYQEIRITGVFLWIKDPDPLFSRIRIRVTQKDLIRIRNADIFVTIRVRCGS